MQRYPLPKTTASQNTEERKEDTSFASERMLQWVMTTTLSIKLKELAIFLLEFDSKYQNYVVLAYVIGVLSKDSLDNYSLDS